MTPETLATMECNCIIPTTWDGVHDEWCPQTKLARAWELGAAAVIDRLPATVVPASLILRIAKLNPWPVVKQSDP